MKEKLLTISDVAMYFNMSYQTIWQHVKDGSIPHVRVGKSIRIPQSIIDDIMADFLK